MNRPDDRQVDKFGFPLPIDATTGAPRGARRRQRGGGRWIVLLLLVVFFFAAAYGLLRSPIFAGPRNDIADQSVLRAAQQLQFEDDVKGAMRHLNIAIFLAPDNVKALQFRSHLRVETGDLDGALSDANRLVELLPREPNAYSTRAYVLHSREMHLEAVADAKKTLELRGPTCPISLNSLSYARALANVELDQALKDVEKALTFELDDGSLAAFLDTRGYIKFLLGDPAAAEMDLTTAINMYEQQLAPVWQGQRLDKRQRGGSRSERMVRGSLSVMYYHRGLVRKALGDAGAEADLQTAQQFGYNPAKGNF